MDTLSLALISWSLALFLWGSTVVIRAAIRRELPRWAFIIVAATFVWLVVMVFLATHQTPTPSANPFVHCCIQREL